MQRVRREVERLSHMQYVYREAQPPLSLLRDCPGKGSKDADFGLEPGARVRLHSLQAAFVHNNKLGVLETFHEDSGRWQVKLDSADSLCRLSVRPQNLTLVVEDKKKAVLKPGHDGRDRPAPTSPRVSVAHPVYKTSGSMFFADAKYCRDCGQGTTKDNRATCKQCGAARWILAAEVRVLQRE